MVTVPAGFSPRAAPVDVKDTWVTLAHPFRLQKRLTTPMSDNLPKKTIHFTKTAYTMQNIVIRGAICP